MDLKEFFRTILMTFNPGSYEKLVERKLGHTFNYFIDIVFLVLLATLLISIPRLVTMPTTVANEMNAFDTFDIKIEKTMNKPIMIPEGRPMVVIDTTKNYTSLEKGKILFTSNGVFYKLLPLTLERKIVREGTLLDDKAQAGTLFTVILVALLPSLFLLAFVYLLLKYALIAFVSALIAFIAVRVVRFGVTFEEIVKVAFYSSTIMIVLGLMTKPFIPFIYYLEYVAFALFMVMGIMKVGTPEYAVRPKRKKSVFE